MVAVIERRQSRAAWWSPRIAWFSLILFVVAGLGHRYGQIDTVSFLWLLGIIGALALTALLAATTGFYRLWQRGDKGGRSSLAGALVALMVLTPFVISAARALATPELTDVATDLEHPPELAVAASERSGQMNPVVPAGPLQIELQRRAYPGVTGRRYEAAPDRVLAAVRAEVAARGWTMRGEPLANGPAETLIEATAYTTIFAFPVDVAIRIADEDASTYLDMRSVSRYGRRDLGDNAARIESFLAAIDAAMKTGPADQAE